MDTDLTPYEALMACLEKAGSQTQLAADLGCSQGAVWKMLQTRRISPQFVLKAERAYGVPRHLLRPDYYPFEPHPPRWYGVDRTAGEVAFQSGRVLNSGEAA